MNLDGLIATEEKQFDFSKDAPILKRKKLIQLPSITNTPKGVFIVELIGNGLSSRAIIKKGKL